MTDAKPQTEPTMEEILASIRRIISENDEEQEAKKRTESATAPQPQAKPEAKPAYSSDSKPNEAADPVAEPVHVWPAAKESAPPEPIEPCAPDDEPGAAVLELTDMIAEDGTVISLATGKPYRPPVVEEDASPEMAEPLPLTELADEIATIDVSDDAPTEIPSPPAADVASEAPQPTSDETIAPSDEPAQNAESMMENAKDNGNAGKTGPDGLVSPNTAAAATATFAQLARSMAQEPQSTANLAVGSGATLEDIVREMLRPMLKDWLDQNLPKMVEHMVRRELDRMVRRAEDV